MWSTDYQIMYALKEAVQGGAPPHKNNLIGTVARGWPQIGPFKMDTKALFIASSLACLFAAACSKNWSLIALRRARSLPHHQADEPKELNTDKLREELQVSPFSRNQATANHRRASPVTSRNDVSSRRFPSTIETPDQLSNSTESK